MVKGGEPAGSVGIAVFENSMEIRYTLNDEGKHMQYDVPLVWTPCNYGGQRAWFLCPNHNCGRRVAKIYLVGGYFICRHCGGMVYQSQHENRADRLLSKHQKIRRRLGGSLSTLAPFPDKPKHMHWRTYWKLRTEAEKAEAMSWRLVGREIWNSVMGLRV